MPRILTAAAAILLLLLALFLLYGKQDAPNTELPLQAPSSLTNKELPANSSERSAKTIEQKAPQIDAQIASEWQLCFAEKALPVSAVDDIGGQILSALSSANQYSTLEWKNEHYEQRDGKKIRLRFTREFTPDQKEYFRLRVFREDAEGLPDPILIPEQEAHNPSKSVVEKYRAGAKLVYTEQGELWTWPNARAEVEKKNGQVVQFQWEAGKTHFACGMGEKDQLSCKCLSRGNGT